jgi:hypothetical protein
MEQVRIAKIEYLTQYCGEGKLSWTWMIQQYINLQSAVVGNRFCEARTAESAKDPELSLPQLPRSLSSQHGLGI